MCICGKQRYGFNPIYKMKGLNNIYRNTTNVHSVGNSSNP